MGSRRLPCWPYLWYRVAIAQQVIPHLMPTNCQWALSRMTYHFNLASARICKYLTAGLNLERAGQVQRCSRKQTDCGIDHIAETGYRGKRPSKYLVLAKAPARKRLKIDTTNCANSFIPMPQVATLNGFKKLIEPTKSSVTKAAEKCTLGMEIVGMETISHNKGSLMTAK
ncbi:hypothetical protein BC943DRAFT_167601 [Umbelopsis sp. AD052]|nr:hypothetical protein BC943DRAFT_167601 [Umbelopsis sp. AD052]